MIFGGDDAPKKIIFFNPWSQKIFESKSKLPFKNFFWGNKPLFFNNKIFSVSIGASKEVIISLTDLKVRVSEINF